MLNILIIYFMKILFVPWSQDCKTGGPLPECFCFSRPGGMFGAVGFSGNILSEYSHNLQLRNYIINIKERK